MGTTSRIGTSDSILPPGQFRIQFGQLIGQGGLGMVHRVVVIASNAAAKTVGSEWAAKRLNSKWANHPTARARFDREIGALKAMSHPNIVTYEGENLPNSERFYVMPVYASSVRHYIAGGGSRGNWREVATFGIELAKALHYAHELGFIHRDFKPDNVLFNGGGPLVIADWGLGYFVHRDSEVLQQLTVGGMGTEYYCSIEQWATGKCDCRGDVYSLGMTLDEWVTGRQRSIIVGSGINGPTTDDQGVGARHFNAILRDMTQQSRKHRPTTMREVAAALANAAGL